jgi:hypothetical protein
VNARVLRRADAVITLDDAMATTVRARRGGEAAAGRLHIVPPWAPPLAGDDVAHADNAWRLALGIGARRLIMYSGNHSPVHPLRTLAEAACALRDDRLRFAFVGGGGGKAEVVRAIPGALDLPYQPLAALRQSLAAADVHVVSVGESTVGVVHPSKLYGALAAGRPVLVFAPPEAPAARVVDAVGCGWCVAHGDHAAAQRVLQEIANAPADTLTAMGARAAAAATAAGPWSRERAIGAFCEVLERAAEARPMRRGAGQLPA